MTIAKLVDRVRDLDYAVFALSLEEAQRRRQGRDTDSASDVKIRVEMAASEMEAAKDFDYTVVNETGQLEQAVRRVFEIIAIEKARRNAP